MSNWWPNFVVKLKKPNISISDGSTYVFSEEYHIWYMSDQNPAEIAEKLILPPPISSDKIPSTLTSNSSKKKYVDFSGMSS